MKRNNTEQVGDIIRQFLRQEGLESPLNEYRLIESWKDVVGPAIARYTSKPIHQKPNLACPSYLIGIKTRTHDGT